MAENGVKGIPEGSSVLIPRLFCRDVVAEIDFCTTHEDGNIASFKIF